jgi:hypothetical protein
MAVLSNNMMSEATEVVTVLEIPASTLNAMGSINLVNTGSTDAVVNIYIGSTSVPAIKDAIEWELPLTPRRVLSRTCGPLAAGEKVFVLSTNSDVSIRVTAIVEAM